MPVYFSTGGYKNFNTVNVVRNLISNGLNYIELSVTSYAPDNIKRLTEFKSTARFQIHNYFPPPKDPPITNMAKMVASTFPSPPNPLAFNPFVK